MRPYDFSPLYRSFVGFDRTASLIDAASAQAAKANTSYPPYNVVRLSEDSFRIELAVAGFTPETLAIETHENVLSISSQSLPKAGNDGAEYLHRGIAERDFDRRFQLADHVRVSAAELSNGLLTIDLVREIPDALKPKKIEIRTHSLRPDGKLIQPTTGKTKKAA